MDLQLASIRSEQGVGLAARAPRAAPGSAAPSWLGQRGSLAVGQARGVQPAEPAQFPGACGRQRWQEQLDREEPGSSPRAASQRSQGCLSQPAPWPCPAAPAWLWSSFRFYRDDVTSTSACGPGLGHCSAGPGLHPAAAEHPHLPSAGASPVPSPVPSRLLPVGRLSPCPCSQAPTLPSPTPDHLHLPPEEPREAGPAEHEGLLPPHGRVRPVPEPRALRVAQQQTQPLQPGESRAPPCPGRLTPGAPATAGSMGSSLHRWVNG